MNKNEIISEHIRSLTSQRRDLSSEISRLEVNNSNCYTLQIVMEKQIFDIDSRVDTLLLQLEKGGES